MNVIRIMNDHDISRAVLAIVDPCWDDVSTETYTSQYANGVHILTYIIKITTY